MTPLGLPRGQVVVEAYDPIWPAMFSQAARELEEAVGESIMAVHHVGSTSVPGLCAKPILDILVSIGNIDEVPALVPALDALGYELRPDPEIPERRYFRRPRGGEIRTHHLSFAEPASRHYRVTLAFRDALRGSARLAAEYAKLKQELAIRYPRDRESYIAGKSDFILRVLKP
jgi:GrpB-like predicted nucleotidyltransferase (UPF0157 family)